MIQNKSYLSWNVYHNAFARVYYHMAEKPISSHVLIWLYFLFDWIQMILMFPLNTARQFPWAKAPIMSDFLKVFDVLMLAPTDTTEFRPLKQSSIPASNLFIVAVIFCVILWVTFIAISLYHSDIDGQKDEEQMATVERVQRQEGRMSYGELSNKGAKSLSSQAFEMLTNPAGVRSDHFLIQVPDTVMRILCALASLGRYALITPITLILLTPLNCKGYWQTSTFGTDQCMSGAHLPFFILSIILIPLWVFWCIFTAAVVVNPVPDFEGKFNPIGVAHGRVEVAMVIVRLVMCIARVFGDLLPPPVYVVMVTLSGIVWLGLYVYFLPFYHQMWNRLQAAAACIYISCCVGLIIGLALGDNNNESSALGVFILLPVSLYVGYSMATIRFRIVGTTAELTSPYLVELRSRYILHEGLTSLGSGQANRLFTSEVAVSSEHLTSAMDYNDAGILNKAAVSKKLNSISQVEEASIGRHGTRESRDYVRSTVREMDKILRSGCQMFPNSALMNLFYATFQSYFRKNKHLERVFLRHAHNHSENIYSYDVNFFVYQRVLNIFLHNLDNSTTALTVDRRMAYEHLLALSKGQTDECRQQIAQFWAELAHRRPDLRQLQTLGARIVRSLRRTNDTYLRLLDLAPQSASLMRLYAGFLIELGNDPQQAQEFLQDAETLEDEQAKLVGAQIDAEVDFGGVPTEFDISGEGIAWIRVSAESASLGIIMDCNAEFLKLYGYTRRELIGKEMSFLTPEPICSLHPYFLRKYQLLGEEKVSNRNCFALAQHRNGHVVPVRINIRPAGHEYITILEEIPTPCAYLLFLGENYNYRITAMCKFAATILGIQPSQLNLKSNIGVSLRTFLQEDIHEFFERADAEEGTTTVVLNESPVIARFQRMDLNFLDCDLHILRFRLVASSEDTIADNITGAHMDRHSQVSSSASYDNASNHADSLHGNASISDYAERGSHEDTKARTSPPLPPTAAANESVTFRPDVASRSARKNVSLALPGQIPPGHEDHFNGDITKCPFMSNGAADKEDFKVSFRPGDRNDTTDNRTRSLVLSQDSEEEDDDIMRILDGDAPASGSASRSASGSGPAPHMYSSVSIPSRRSSLAHTHVHGADAQLVESEARRYSIDLGSPPHSSHPASPFLAGRSSSLPENMPEPVRQVTIQSGSERLDGTRVRETGTARFGTVEERIVPQLTWDDKVEDPALGHEQDLWDEEGEQGQRTSGSRKNGEDGKQRQGVSMAKSVRSGSSSYTSASSMSLRKGISSQAMKLEGSLLTLKAAIIAVFILIAFLNIICILVSRVQFEKADANINNISDNGLRMIFLSRGTTAIQDLQLVEAGRLNLTGGITVDDLRDRLMFYIGRSETVHRKLYMALDPDNEEENYVYKDPHIVVRDIIPGTFVDKLNWEYSNRTTNLVNLGLEVYAKMRLVHSNQYANLTDPNAWFLWYNVPNIYIHALNDSMILSEAQTDHKVHLVHLSNVAVSVVALATLVIVILLVIVPSINSVIESRNRVFNIFLDLKPSIFRRLRNNVQKRIDAMAKEAAGEEFNPEDIPDPIAMGNNLMDDKDGAGSVLSRFTFTRDSVSMRDDLDDDDEDEYDDYAEGTCDKIMRFLLCRSNKVDAADKRQREFQNASSSHTLLIFQVIWPLLTYAVFYVLMFFNRHAAIDESYNFSKEVFWSRQNEVHTSFLNLMIREAYGSCEPNVIYHVLGMAENSAAAVEYIQDSILYGNNALGVRSGLQENPEIYKIALENACFDNPATFGYTYEECMTEFHHGIFANGAQQAMQEYLSLTRELIRARKEVFWETYQGLLEGNTTLAMQLCASGSNFFDWRLPIVDVMAWNYLDAALRSVSASIVAAKAQFFNNYYRTDLLATVISILMLFVFYFTIYRSTVKKLDSDIKEVRHLLLLLPDEIANKSTAVMLYEEELLKTDRSGKSWFSFFRRKGKA